MKRKRLFVGLKASSDRLAASTNKLRRKIKGARLAVQVGQRLALPRCDREVGLSMIVAVSRMGGIGSVRKHPFNSLSSSKAALANTNPCLP